MLQRKLGHRLFIEFGCIDRGSARLDHETSTLFLRRRLNTFINSNISR